MFCSRCGKELPQGSTACSVCETPQKKRGRQVRRLWIGLFVFLAGAMVGSFVDSVVFRGHGFDQGIWQTLRQALTGEPRRARSGTSAILSLVELERALGPIHALASGSDMRLSAGTDGDWVLEINGVAPSPAQPKAIGDRLLSAHAMIRGVQIDVKPAKDGPAGTVEYRFRCRLAAAASTGPAGAEPVPGTPTPTSGSNTKALAESGSQAVAREPSSAAADQSAIQKNTPAATSPTAVVAVAVPAPVASLPVAPASPASSTEAADTGIFEPGSPTATDSAVAVAPVRPYKVAMARAETLVEHPAQDFQGTLSADGKTLLFSGKRPAPEGSPERFQCLVKTLGDKQPERVLFTWPGDVWTPTFVAGDNTRVVFSSNSEPDEQVFVYDLVQRKGQRLTRGKHKAQTPSPSPDGRFVAYVSNEKGNNDIWVLDLQAPEAPTRVTDNPDDEREPRWSPDGRTLYFTRIKKKLADSAICKVSLEPLEAPVEIIADGKRNWLPDISPDGQYLAYVRSEKADGSGNTVVLHRLADKWQTTLKPVPGREDFRPIWAPDGASLILHSEGKAGRDIYRFWLKKTEQE